MDFSKELKDFLAGVLKLQEKYGWMMDNYVLDFFTANLWLKLPTKWSDALDGLKPQEIGYFLLQMYTSIHTLPMFEKQFFRNVWPLELLAFVASCHALNLHNQPFVDQSERTCWNVGRTSVTKTTASDVVSESTNLSSSWAQKVRKTSSTLKPKIEMLQHGGQNMNLYHAFRYHVKPKKQHEIDVLSSVICEVADKLQCHNVVDVGAGLGHLSRLLSYGCKLHVVTIEGDSGHLVGAEKCDRKVLNQLQKEKALSEQINSCPSYGSLVHITHQISADISSAEFLTIVSDAFNEMASVGEVLPNNAGSLKSPGVNSCENFIIVGLHACGDLTPTLLRVFTQCEEAVGLVSVGCCYMKLSHEKAAAEKGKLTMAQKRLVTDSASRCCDTSASNEGYKGTADAEVTLGYPMSEYLRNFPGHRQTYNALEAACHALENYRKRLLEESPTLKLHFYRALLEMLLKQKNPGWQRRQIRSLNTKKAAKMRFTEYVVSACDILGVEEDRPTIDDIHLAEIHHAGKEFNVVIYYVLRLLMAPLIEGRILVDRLLFIKELRPDIDARLSKLFDPAVSPRNYAIVAERRLDDNQFLSSSYEPHKTS